MLTDKEFKIALIYFHMQLKANDVFPVFLCHVECVMSMSRVEKWNRGKERKTRGFRELEQFGKIVPTPGFFIVILWGKISTALWVDSWVTRINMSYVVEIGLLRVNCVDNIIWIFRFKSARLPFLQGIVCQRFRAVHSDAESTFVFGWRSRAFVKGRAALQCISILYKILTSEYFS